MSIAERARSTYTDVGNRERLTEKPPLPRTMMIEVSNACNHACHFCPSPQMVRTKGLIDVNFCCRLLKEAAREGLTEIGFYTTGEPFLHKGLAAMTACAKKAGIGYLYVSTNGSLATLDRVIPVIEAGMDSIKFSINAGSRATYRRVHGKDDWEAVLANLKALSDYRRANRPDLKLYVTSSATPFVAHEVESLRKLLAPLVDEVSIFPASLLAAPDQETSGGARICTLPFTRLHVTCEGFLTACCVDYENYLVYADLAQASLREAWENATIRQLRQRHLQGNLAGLSCSPCWTDGNEAVAPLRPDLTQTVDFQRYIDAQRRNFDILLTPPTAEPLP